MTNASAITTAGVEKARAMPWRSRNAPSSPRRPKASSSPTPATAGGITAGSCATLSRNRAPRPGCRAMRHASRVPKTITRQRLQPVVSAERRSAGPRSGLRNPAARSAAPSVVASATMGSVRKTTSSAAAPKSAASQARIDLGRDRQLPVLTAKIPAAPARRGPWARARARRIARPGPGRAPSSARRSDRQPARCAAPESRSCARLWR